MGTFKTSEGERLSKSVINSRVTDAKRMFSQDNYDNCYCFECGTNSSIIDISHIVSVNDCQNNGKAEQSYNTENFEYLCRSCHRLWEDYKKLNIKRAIYIMDYFPELYHKYNE